MLYSYFRVLHVGLIHVDWDVRRPWSSVSYRRPSTLRSGSSLEQSSSFSSEQDRFSALITGWIQDVVCVTWLGKNKECNYKLKDRLISVTPLPPSWWWEAVATRSNRLKKSWICFKVQQNLGRKQCRRMHHLWHLVFPYLTVSQQILGFSCWNICGIFYFPPLPGLYSRSLR